MRLAVLLAKHKRRTSPIEDIEDAEVEGRPVKWKAYTLKKTDWEKVDWPTKPTGDE